MRDPHPLSRAEEAALIAGCQNGEPAAQRACFDRFRDRVHAVALHFLRGDDAAAQDATQEVFVRFFRRASAFRSDARLSTYLYRATANVCIDELRRRRRFVLVGDIPETLHPRTSTVESLSDPRLVHAVQRLSPKLRLVVLLRYVDDLSYDEIAAAVGVSAGTVASRLSRAHAALATALGSRSPGAFDD
jgi:RNA polymerase sigma-70 factor (ECF subfamily)